MIRTERIRRGGMGTGDQTGRRLRSARLRRGMTLRTLAGLSGLSVGFLSMVENGRRHLDRTSHINALAEALQVAPAELLGRPYPSANPSVGTTHEAVPAIRLALMGVPATGGTCPSTTAGLVPSLEERVAHVNHLYHSGEYAALARCLPDLLSDLHAATTGTRQEQRMTLLRLTMQAYYPACTLLLKALGYTDLAFLAVTRATECATELDDPGYRALSGFFHTHVLLAAGDPDHAYAHAEQAAGLLERNMRERTDRVESLALLGELHLIRATASTQQVHRRGSERVDAVRDHLREASSLARRTGETRAWNLNFGPTNVGIHQVSLNTDLGLHGAAIHAGQALRKGIASPPGRMAVFHADLGRALASQRGRYSEAVAELITAERIAPQRVQADPTVRQVIIALLDRQLPAQAARNLRGLVHRTGL